MEHPPKQGLKHKTYYYYKARFLRFNGTSTKTRIETEPLLFYRRLQRRVLMEHPPKQGLKLFFHMEKKIIFHLVLMEHPPKQGLKPLDIQQFPLSKPVLMEHPPKQGLKHASINDRISFGFVLMEHPPKQGLKQAVKKNVPIVNKKF